MKYSSKTPRAFTAAWAVACVFAIGGTARATAKLECQNQIDAIRNDLSTVDIHDAHPPGRTNSQLDLKLVSARTKLDARKGAKCGDALQALWDFIDKVDALAIDGKMERNDADRLLCETNSEFAACASMPPPPPSGAAIQCIVALDPGVCADSVTP